MPPYTIDINLTKSKWTPKHIEQFAEVVSHAFGRTLTLDDIKPITATDHVKEWEVENDDDIAEFLKAPNVMQEAFAEKVIRVREPRPRLMPKKWIPKKVKLLVRGEKLAKFFGEDTMGSREVCSSLKLFDCGHFYLKQTLPGSGPTPFWTIYEGKWEQKENGLRLVYCVHYSWQASMKSDPSTSIECVPKGLESSLAWVGESENQLNGMVPAVVGEERMARIEIVREPDKVEKNKIRFNEDLIEAEGNAEAAKAAARSQDSAAASGSTASGQKLEPRAQWRSGGGAAGSGGGGASAGNDGAAANAASSASAGGGAASRPSSRPAAAAARPAGGFGDKADDAEGADEPLWPMLLGLSIFVGAVALGMSRWWEDMGKTPESGAFW
eukprot:TRINITY_DN73190_c0_g1_i1.p1 TRINITY_DN73190_c0_g1~~TRINITY_DN73190_c0_g1_i1.p1  ORF type:complete len:383 (+),score=131.63 TRINITY_DN73190_c0_g1_i1:136-1284(+)